MKDKIIIQAEKINPAIFYKEVYDFLDDEGGGVGAVVVFTGVMRGHNQQGAIKKMTIEYYDKMTEQTINNIIAAARKKFLLHKVMVVHRVGDIAPRDHIVVVGVAAAHRADSFQAAEMIMDYLKAEAPFWKEEIMTENHQSHWPEQKPADIDAAKKWQ